MNLGNLAVNGGAKAVKSPLKGRFHVGEEEKAAAVRLFDGCVASGNAFGYNGPEEEGLAREFAAFMGGGYADGVNSGTNAVFVALWALQLPPFSEVVVSPVTDPGGIMPIVMCNCIPVVADTAPGSFNVGPEQLRAAITPETRAVVLAHIGGEPADIEGIMAVAREFELPVIEDCAQSHGATVNGRKVGTFGTYGAFSLMFGKHFCAGGQGGAVFCRDEEHYWAARRAADRGKPFGLEGHTNGMPALNCNMGELGAAIGREQLKKLPSILERRRRFVALLTAAGIGELESITIPELLPGAEHAYWWWRLKLNLDRISVDKATYCAALQAEGVLLNPDYSAALPFRFEWFQERWTRHPWNNPLYKGDAKREVVCPNALQSVAEHFILFTYESWGEEEAAMVVEAFRKVDAAYAKK